MNDFIMRKNKDIVLRICILHGKCHHMMCIFPEIRIQLHILCKIMHPSHIPLQAESQSVILRVSCNLWPCSGFFCDHHRPRISSKYNRIKMLEKLNRLKILIATILVWDPLSVLLSIIKIKHGCHCIDTQSVHMEMLDPEQCICNQEIPYLRLFIIKDLRSPVRMLSLSRICILKSRCSVKISQSVSILREMCRNPVKNHTNPIPVQIIDHISKIFRCSISGSRCIITGYLISP